MKPKAILFDLDGTLLPMDQDAFANVYVRGLAAAAAADGYDPHTMADAILAGTAAMVRNDGEKTNEDVFWDVMTNAVGASILQKRAMFDDFYRTGFQTCRTVCGCNPRAQEIVRTARDTGACVVLATNPLFPAVATHIRIRWAGLQPDDFSFITTYETARHCKPNPDYYRDILESLGLSGGECVMIGNDVGEDMIAAQLGMRVFLLTETLINRRQDDISVYPHGDTETLIAFLRALRQ